MVRYYKRPISRKNADKYSVESTALLTSNTTTWETVPSSGSSTSVSRQNAFIVVPPSETQGMRKVKHLTLSFTSQSDSAIYYALVYVPNNYSPSNLSIPSPDHAISLYEPSQFLMSSGVLDFTGGPCRIHCPLSRNLNQGDNISLVLAVYDGANTDITVNIISR